jgi:hypothetical protein
MAARQAINSAKSAKKNRFKVSIRNGGEARIVVLIIQKYGKNAKNGRLRHPKNCY